MSRRLVMQTLRWAGITVCTTLAVVGVAAGSIHPAEQGGKAAVANWGLAGLFAGFAALLWRRAGLRWTVIAVCVIVAIVGLVAGILYFREGSAQGVKLSWAGAASFTGVAVALLRRGRH